MRVLFERILKMNRNGVLPLRTVSQGAQIRQTIRSIKLKSPVGAQAMKLISMR